MSAPAVDEALVDQVRNLLAEAAAAGRPRPGRPTLTNLTGATDHQVRKALAALENQPTKESPSAEQAPTEPQTGPSPIPVRQARPWPLILIGLAAAVAVWDGWVELGQLTGFGMVQPLPGLFDDLRINTAIVLPLGIEAYGGYALRTWLSSAVLSDRTRSFARWSAIASLVVGAGAQVASHLMRASNLTTAPPLVTVLVACVPVLVLGLATGLATLVKRDTSAGGDR
jgi:hypothetical protein